MTGAVWHRASIVLFAVAGILAIATFRDYGIAWDEHFHDTYGKAVLRHFESRLSDQEALTYFNLWLYGAAFDVLSAIAKRILPFGDYEVQHLSIAVAGLAGAWATVRIGRLIGGERAGFVAGLLLLATPSWWGHMFINPKDIPFASAMTWTLYWSMRMAGELPQLSARTLIWLGLSFGAALGIRVAGIYAAVYPAFSIFIWFILQIGRRKTAGIVRDFISVIRGSALVVVVAYCTMLLAWPWALRDPLRRPFEAFAVFANTPWDIRVLFEGTLVSSMALPATYLPVYLAVKLPIFIIFAVLAVTIIAIRRIWNEGASKSRIELTLLAFSVGFPILTFVAIRPVTYDGIRHFLFLLPPISVAAAMGVEELLIWSDPKPLLTRAKLFGLFALFGSMHLAYLHALHPYQYVYYNEFVRGVRGAHGSFELDYWGTSYREAAIALDRFLETEGSRGTYSVFVCSEGSSAEYFFSPHLVLSRDDLAADFYLSTTRLNCDSEYYGDTVLTINRDGAALAVVKDRRRLRKEAPELLAHQDVAGALVSPRHPGLLNDGRPGLN